MHVFVSMQATPFGYVNWAPFQRPAQTWPMPQSALASHARWKVLPAHPPTSQVACTAVLSTQQSKVLAHGAVSRQQTPGSLGLQGPLPPAPLLELTLAVTLALDE